LYEKYGSEWNGGCWRDEGDENWVEYSTYNPNSKWDWYVMGGRWRGMLKLKEGKVGVLGEAGVFKNESMIKGGVDQAKFGDIDWDFMNGNPNDFEKYNRIWELIVEDDKPKNKDEEEYVIYPFYTKKGLLEKYKTKETYLKAMMTFSTYAVLKDGEWFEPGEMGWFGISHAEDEDKLDFELNFFDKFLKDLPDEALLTIVDCHI